MNCDNFYNKVSRYFQYLFEEYDFKVIHSSNRYDQGYCLIILGSPSFQVRIFYERGSIQADLGSVGAAANWPNSSLDKGVWYPLRLLVDFIGGKTTLTDQDIRISGERISKLTVDENLSELSSYLKPVVNDVKKVFSNPHESQSLKNLKIYLGT
jgi:hypothetical protein